MISYLNRLSHEIALLNPSGGRPLGFEPGSSRFQFRRPYNHSGILPHKKYLAKWWCLHVVS